MLSDNVMDALEYAYAHNHTLTLDSSDGNNWVLELRKHDSSQGVEYSHIANVTLEEARELYNYLRVSLNPYAPSELETYLA